MRRKPKIERMTAVTVRPGDTLIVELAQPVSLDEFEEIRDGIEKRCGERGFDVMLLSGLRVAGVVKP